MQYHDTGWFGPLMTFLVVVFVIFNISRARKGKELFIRRIAGLNAIDEAVGRATEMGRPVLMVPGLGELNANSVQAINIFAYVTRLAAKFATPIRVCCGNAPVFTVAQEIIRDVYQQEGMSDRYDPDCVRFLSDRQFAFAAAVSGLINREKTAATFLLGEFFAESLIFAESANAIGAIQIAGSVKNTQTPFFIASCDYVLIADEFFAASAYLTREKVLTGSLVGQDWAKMVVIFLVFFGFLMESAQRRILTDTSFYRDGSEMKLDEAMLMKPGDTMVSRMFRPRALIRGTMLETPKQFPTMQDYESARKAELNAVSGPTPAGGDQPRAVAGTWMEWRVQEGDNERAMQDLVVTKEDGSVEVIREYRGRQYEVKPVAAGGTE